tara:strand:- start:54 stop:1043 length:990 start_codon:yes stop_codon:yes gene_type:complete
MIVKLSDLMKDKKETRNFYLFYGSNIGQIEEVINNMLKPKFSKNIYNYDENEIISNISEFEENILNKSFFDNEKLIIINRGSDKILKIIENLLQKNITGTVIVVKTNILEKKSKLRNFFEKNSETICTPFYEDNYQSLMIIAQNFFVQNKIKISPQNINFIVEKSRKNRIILRSELDKIKIFCKKKLSIELNDILKLTNSSENYNISELTDQCLAKNTKKTIHILNENISSIEDNILILKSFLYKLKRLKKLKEEIKIKKNSELAISSFKPPIFWKEKDIIKQQLKILSLADIQMFIKKINYLELLIKKNSNLSNQIVNNFILETVKAA